MPHKIDFGGARRLREYQRAQKSEQRKARREARRAEGRHLGHAVELDPTITGPAVDPERVPGLE